MFNKILIEKAVKDNPYTQNILNFFPKLPVQYINNLNDFWGRVKKPYLQKRDHLQLFIGRKEGQLVKEAPAAYGLGHEKHFYFIHAYNCIYECQYCYLQGYFNTPDIVLFVNHQDILDQMQSICHEYPDSWFHAGEYSDSLALGHITGEWSLYWDFFKKNPEAKLELRTKAVNIKSIENLEPLENIYISFSLSSHEGGKEFDQKTPSIKARLKAIKKLADLGFKLGIHFDPIIYKDDFIESYQEVIQEVFSIIPQDQLGYVSIGVVRFTKSVYKEVEKNYSDSTLLAQDFIKSFDNKVRYSHPMRMWLMHKVKDLCLKENVAQEKIYLCMEDDF